MQLSQSISFFLFLSFSSPLTPTPAFPELPCRGLSPPALALGHLIAALYPPEEDRNAREDECDDDDRLQRLREDGPAEEEQADAAEDDGRSYPGFVRPFQMWLLHSQDDEAENGEEVEGVSRHAIKGQEFAEFADDHVGCGE